MDPTSGEEGSGTSTRKEDILSQKVSGEFIRCVVYEECVVKYLAFSTDLPDHLRLFRTCVSRKAAIKGRPVLEGVGLSAETIEACFSSHPLNEEEAVQAGLTKWSGGQGLQPPTWEVLIEAMEYAQIAQRHIKGLKENVASWGYVVYASAQCVECLHTCVCVCACVCTYICVCMHVCMYTSSGVPG